MWFMDWPIWINIIHQHHWNSRDHTMLLWILVVFTLEGPRVPRYTPLHITRVTCSPPLRHGGRQTNQASKYLNQSRSPSFPGAMVAFFWGLNMSYVEVMQGGPLPDTSPPTPFIRPIYRGYNRGPPCACRSNQLFPYSESDTPGRIEI